MGGRGLKPPARPRSFLGPGPLLTRPAPAPHVDATYRLQLHAGFTLVDALRQLPYVENLGISHLYLSPIFAARPGSVHGYDVVDPTRVNPELGGADALEALADGLQARRMGLILDLVPNHMAADHHNPWWLDVLTHGPASAHARFFDIDWASPQAPAGRVLLPFLGAPLHEVLSGGEIRPVLERPPALEGHADSNRKPPPELAFYARYHDRLFPLEPGTWPDILRAADGPLPPSLEALVRDLEAIPGFRTTDERAAVRRRRTAAEARRTLAHLAATDPAAGEALRRALAALIVRPGATPGAADTFAGILARQPWLLLHHTEARRRLNYRRFFDITDLIGVRVEDEAVFAVTHSLVLDLAERGRIAGVRVDHVDGLLDPTGYLIRLRDQLAERGGRQVPIWVEKILSPGEELPAEWPVTGTTGYEFLNALGHVFVDAEGLTRLGRFYDDFTGRNEPFSEVRHRSKRLVLTELLGAEMRGLGERLARLSRNDPATRDEGAARGDPAGELLSPAALTEALLEVTASLTVYRTYIRDAAVSERDRVLIDEAVDDALRRDPGHLATALEYLRRLLSLRPSLDGPSCDGPSLDGPSLDGPSLGGPSLGGPSLGGPSLDEALDLVLAWQQVSGPAMAKGVEDTAFYRYNRLISLQEVGGEVGGDPEAVAEFHRHNLNTLALRPDSMSATSTHDTKRSEDVRARIDVLAEAADAFTAAVARWHHLNAHAADEHDESAGPRGPSAGPTAGPHAGLQASPHAGPSAPNPNEEYLLYQTLLGAWPLRRENLPAFRERVGAFLVKSVREAKEDTSWLQPDLSYEDALQSWVRAILTPGDPSGGGNVPPEPGGAPLRPTSVVSGRGGAFLEDFLPLQSRVAWYGMLVSLAQVVAKVAAPGIPDFYQGSYLWDLSLVDPDNRRPVDFGERHRILLDLDETADSAPAPRTAELLRNWTDGRIKLFVTRRALRARRAAPALFARGDYQPLQPMGRHAERVLAFARRHEESWAMVVVPRLPVGLAAAQAAPLGPSVWGDTRVPLPSGAPAVWTEVCSGTLVHVVDEAGNAAGRKPADRGALNQGSTSVLVGDALRYLPVALLRADE